MKLEAYRVSSVDMIYLDDIPRMAEEGDIVFLWHDPTGTPRYFSSILRAKHYKSINHPEPERPHSHEYQPQSAQH